MLAGDARKGAVAFGVRTMAGGTGWNLTTWHPFGKICFPCTRSAALPLRPAARKLDQLAQFLTEHPERRVQIDGFTDRVGTESYNLDLSQRRAGAVKSSLITRGIDPSRIGSQGYGKSFPVAGNTNSGGRQLNRRVEVVIGGDTGASIAARS
jgi:hypothetical protein